MLETVFKQGSLFLLHFQSFKTQVNWISLSAFPVVEENNIALIPVQQGVKESVSRELSINKYVSQNIMWCSEKKKKRKNLKGGHTKKFQTK